MPLLAHLHMIGCPCSRCSVSRNYARLLAAQALRDEADAAHDDAMIHIVVSSEPERSHLDVMGHG